MKKLYGKNYRLILIILPFLIIGLLIIGLVLLRASFTKSQTISQAKLSEFAQIPVQQCQSVRDWRRCYGEKLGVFNKTHTLHETISVLNNVEELDSKTRDCHLIAHKIASEEVAKDPENWLEMFKIVNQDMCIGGYIHGAFEGKKRFDSDLELNAETIPQICETINQKTGQKNSDPCAHVIGHVVLAEAGGDLQRATQICNELPAQLKASCNNGSFMENITRDNLVEHSLAEHIPFDETNAGIVEKICDSYVGVSRTSCWREISHLYVSMAKNNPQQIWKFCSRASSPQNRDECYVHSFNSFLTNPIVNTDSLSDLCTPYVEDEAKVSHCIDWAVHVLLYSSLKLVDRAQSMCQSFSQSLHSFCFQTIEEDIKKISSNNKNTKICDELPSAYKTDCLGSD